MSTDGIKKCLQGHSDNGLKSIAKAFEEGIFKMDKPCYLREFMPYWKKK